MNDGGPAFPTNFQNYADGLGGMTLRDWFAGQALASISVEAGYSSGPCNASVAERAYHIADAMLALRNKNAH